MSISMTQFVWPTDFACTIFTDNLILPTTYNISVSIDPGSASQNINPGFRKLRSLVDIRLQNSIFISQDNPLSLLMSETLNNQVMFPSEPYDYIVGCILLSKMIAVTEQYFQIEYITIDSLIGDHVQYTIIDPAESGLELGGNFWWNTDNLDTGSSNDISWDDLDIGVGPKFEPRIIRGGLSENK
jgi:hypothetical protein